jgi:type II secretory pathway pseudopilin PulG
MPEVLPVPDRRDSDEPAGGEGRLRGGGGMTLAEILVAVSVSAIVLGAAWPWLWAAGSTARRVDGRAQAATAAAFAARSLAADAELSISLLRPPSGRTPAGCLCMLHLHPGAAPETILVVWDPVRRVLWRKTSGTYLADHVDSFSLEYFRADGRILGQADLDDAEWTRSVARLRISVGVSSPGGMATAVRDVALRS